MPPSSALPCARRASQQVCAGTCWLFTCPAAGPGAYQQPPCHADALSHIRYACLGLGDSNYTRYMAAPRSFRRRFGELGAQDFYTHKEADEVDGIEAAVEDWLQAWPTPSTVSSCLAPQQQHKQLLPAPTLQASHLHPSVDG